MSLHPCTIQIFLPSGDSRGFGVAELTTSIIRVIDVPRKLLDEYLDVPEAKQVEGIHYAFQRDVMFKFPSEASDFIAGASTNDWML